MSEEKKQTPVFKTRAGGISCAIFRNKYKGKEGKADFSVDSIVLQRSYKNKDDQWENDSISFRKSDIIKLQIVLSKVAEQQFLNQDDKEEA